MSLSQFQNALAMLIRLPEINRGKTLSAFLFQFDLNTTESDRVVQLAADAKVVKYGRSMANGRWDGILNRLSVVKNFIKPTLLENLWRLEFEPKATMLNAPEIFIAFYDFLLNHPAAQKALESEAPEFSNDLLRFERAQLSYRCGEMVNPPAPKPESCLQHRKFSFVTLAYDIPELLIRLEQDVPTDFAAYAPVRRPILLMLLGEPFQRSCRYFEITEDIQNFLVATENGIANGADVPNFYSDLVKIGVCKE